MRELIKQIEANEEFREWLLKTHAVFFIKGFSEDKGFGLFPTTAKLAIIQEWLREYKGLSIEATCDFKKGYPFDIYKIDKESIIWIAESPVQYTSYNQALTEGIKEALKLIKE